MQVQRTATQITRELNRMPMLMRPPLLLRGVEGAQVSGAEVDEDGKDDPEEGGYNYRR